MYGYRYESDLNMHISSKQFRYIINPNDEIQTQLNMNTNIRQDTCMTVVTP